MSLQRLDGAEMFNLSALLVRYLVNIANMNCSGCWGCVGCVNFCKYVAKDAINSHRSFVSLPEKSPSPGISVGMFSWARVGEKPLLPILAALWPLCCLAACLCDSLRNHGVDLFCPTPHGLATDYEMAVIPLAQVVVTKE